MSIFLLCFFDDPPAAQECHDKVACVDDDQYYRCQDHRSYRVLDTDLLQDHFRKLDPEYRMDDRQDQRKQEQEPLLFK